MMKQTIFYFFVGCLLLQSLAFCGCTRRTDTRVEQIRGLMNAQFPADEPGAAILILRGDTLLMAEGYGLADMQTKTPVTTETNFCLASISKQFTAVGILQLCEQGRMALTDEVRTFFPQLTEPIWQGVTVRHILSHTSGIPDARAHFPREMKIFADDNVAVAYFDTLSWRDFLPGEAYKYINPTITLAGKIIEKVSGEEFGAYMAKHVFEPAGMRTSVYFLADHEDDIADKAHGYRQNDKGEWMEYDYGEETFFATRPDGALYCSVSDFAQWEKALRDNVLLSAETAELAWTPNICCTGSPYCTYNNRENTYYGLCWYIEPATAEHTRIIYHTGENGGFHNIAARYPDAQTLVVILSARPDWDQYDMLQQIEAVLGL